MPHFHSPIKLVIFALLFFPLATLDAAELVAPNGAKKLEGYVTSWVGNTYGGLNPQTGKGQWVQQDIAAMCVTPDGTVYTNVPWEEAGGNCMMYRDGEMLGAAMHTHGWGFNGGKAVAVNTRYVYIAVVGSNEGGGLVDADTWPPKGKRWFGVSRRLRSDFTKGAPFDHGKGGKGDTLPKCFLVVNEVDDDNTLDGPGAITGLWATDERLYVANPLTNCVEIYDAETMLKVNEWPLPDEFQGKMGAIAMNPDGNLWMLVQRPHESLLAERFLVFDRNGKLFTKQDGSGNIQYCPIAIPEGCEENYPYNYQASAFCFDNKGRLLVADGNFWHHMVITLEKNGEAYVPSPSALGYPTFTWNVNSYGNLIFFNITAIGCDAQGNVYVASDSSTNGGGVILESYAPTDEPVELPPPGSRNIPFAPGVMDSLSRWKLNWRLYGLCFIDCATLDPDDETFAYTKEERYKIDWSQEPGKEWSFLGTTTRNIREEDARFSVKDSASVWARKFNGDTLLFVNDMNSQWMQVYYANSGFMQAFFAGKKPTFDNWQLRDWLQKEGEWIYHPNVGDSPDHSRLGMTEPTAQGWWVDSECNVWRASEREGIRRFRIGVIPFDIGDTPFWSFAHMDTFPHPSEFTQVKRIRYDAATDTLYLGGCATVDGVEHKNQHWKPMGAVICRYDNFLKGDKPGTTEGKLRWRIVAPYVTGSSGHESCEPMGFDIAGDYMFVPYTGASKVSGFKTGHVEVFRLSDGGSVGWMEPDPKTVGEIGLQDIRECLSAHRRSNGEYVVFLEDDYKAKVVMYRWMPE